MSDDNLCGDMRALVTVLREIRDEQKRCADALEKFAERIAWDEPRWTGTDGGRK